MSPTYRTLSLADAEPQPIVGGQLQWIPVRRELGVRSFGTNAYFGPKAGDEVVEAHDETDATGARHEEMYVVLDGRATFTLDGETLDAPRGTVVFLPDPATKRHAVAAEDGTVVLAVGATVGEPFTPKAWEHWFLAERHALAGDHGAAADVAARGLQEFPNEPMLLYQVACYEALAGRAEAALEHLAKAVALDPDRVRRWAADDEDLAALRDDPRFPA